MPPDAPYAPPFTLTPELLNRVAAIAEALGRWLDNIPKPLALKDCSCLRGRTSMWSPTN